MKLVLGNCPKLKQKMGRNLKNYIQGKKHEFTFLVKIV